jgi:hypothetical protein
MNAAVRIAGAVAIGVALGCLPIVRYWSAAPHAGHAHAPAPAAPEKE